MQHHLGALDGVARLLRVAQVVLGRADHADVRAELLELPHGCLAEEAAAPGDGDLLLFPEMRIRLRGGHQSVSLTARPASWSASVWRSASTMICTSSLNVTVWVQPSLSLAFDGSPWSASTSAERR